jgi:ubiquinone/menaquinone biosynthesis C-methylase UbiE
MRVRSITKNITFTSRISPTLVSKERKRWQNPTAIVRSSVVRESMAVADLGRNLGFFTVLMASLVGETGAVYAMDPDQLMLEHLHAVVRRSGVHNVEIIQGNIKETGIPSRIVNAALFANIFRGISERGPFLNEVDMQVAGRAVDVDWEKLGHTSARHTL